MANSPASADSIPHDHRLDSTLALLAEGDRFMPKPRALNSEVFAARLMLRQALCISGRDAAEMFYSRDRFTRKGAMPPKNPGAGAGYYGF